MARKSASRCVVWLARAAAKRARAASGTVPAPSPAHGRAARPIRLALWTKVAVCCGQQTRSDTGWRPAKFCLALTDWVETFGAFETCGFERFRMELAVAIMVWVVR